MVHQHYGTQTVNRGAVQPGMLVKHKDSTWTASANARGRLYLHRGIERNLEETAQNYMALPADFQRIDGDQKQTATAMKACIKEYNATLPPPVKTSGSRDALLEQLAIINPDLVAQEAQKPAPLKVSGTKADMIQAVKAVKPDAVFADELLDAWRDNPEGKVLVTRQQLSTALNIQKALLAHPTAGMLLTHPSRAVEVSYFGFDEETGLEVRVRPDLEIDLDGVRISNPKQQIAYLALKYWARLYCPAVVLGVYTPDEIEQRTEKEINPTPQRVSLADISGDTVTTTQSAQESSVNVDSLADDFRERIESAQDVDSAKSLRADIETAKATLGSALFTELKNKAVKRYYLVDAHNKVEEAIKSLPQPDEPHAAERFAEAERMLASSKRHLGDELHDQFSITLADMKPEYVA